MKPNGISFQKLTHAVGLRVAFAAILFVAAGAFAQPGSTLWTNHYSDQGGNSRAQAMALDTNGNVFITGYVAFSTFYRYATIAYSNAGQPIWTNIYAGPEVQPYDRASAICVAGNGNVIVTGSSDYLSDDYATIAYSKSGVPLWTNRYDGRATGEDRSTAIAVNGSNEVFVTGYSARTSLSPHDHDYATIKYSNSGLPLWTNLYNGPSNSDDHARSIAVSSNGNVFVTGDSLSTSSVSQGYTTIAYSGAGAPLWTNSYSVPGYANAVTTDGSGNVFVTGGCVDKGNFPEYVTIKYSNSGIPLWTNRYAGAQVKFGGYAAALAIGGNGNVVVTGYSDNSLSNTVFVTIAYSNDGLPLWTNLYSGVSTSGNLANALAIDGSGNVYVTGNSYDTNGEINYATIGYSNVGMPLWTNRYNGTGIGIDSPTSIAVDRSGNAFVTGYSDVDGFGYEYLTLKYAGVNAVGPIPLNFQVMGNQLVLSWPNPVFALQTTSQLDGIFTNILGATSPYTNLMWDNQQFFRLEGSLNPGD